MARLRRLVVPGHAHHLVMQGHNTQSVFADDEDRRAFRAALHEALRTHGVTLQAYALLDKEVQLLLTPPDEAALSRAIQALGRRYVSAFNRRHSRSGTLWAGRFRAAVVQPGDALMHSLRLVDSLEHRRGRAETPAASQWSSAPHRLGTRRDPLVTDPPEYWQLGNTPFEREAAYAALLADALPQAVAARIEHAAAHGWPIGAPAFLAALAAQTGRPTVPRARGRPPRSGPA
jgi:putative transposase